MSLSGSGKFQSFSADRHSNPGSVHHFDVNAPPAVSYEPGTGAEFMQRSGWESRDAYGNKLPRSSRYRARDDDVERGVQFGSSSLKDKNNMTYIIPIVVLSILLILFIIVLIILFATGVFQFRKATPPPPSKPSSDPATSRPAQDHLINRTFECEIFILDQANPAYNDPLSVEYDQASIIIRNALNTLISQSTIRDLTPRLSLERLMNQGNDLRVPFRITLLLLSNSRLTADSIQNVLLSELSLLEIQLNNTVIDRSRVHVRIVE